MGFFLLAFLFIKIFFPYYRVQTSSMEPTFKKGHIIFVNKFQYLRSSPKRNDIVLFKPIEGIFEKGVWTHRIIATEGDMVIISDGIVATNDELVDFPELHQDVDEKIEVPSGFVYQKGDNRKTIHGLVPIRAVQGKIIFSF